jgi:uncharacterized membrane protein YdjX (TVP38/TMEM64 family)
VAISSSQMRFKRGLAFSLIGAVLGAALTLWIGSVAGYRTTEYALVGSFLILGLGAMFGVAGLKSS